MTQLGKYSVESGVKKFEMHRYELIIFWSEEDGRYIVEVPELPGCMADGLTYEEAIKNAEIVISEWIETTRSLGREIPEPKGRLAYA
jgi:predicted RNase H-like HicB family nuclease